MNVQLSITVCSVATVTGSDEDPCDLSTDPYPVDRFSTCSDPDPCLNRHIPDPKLKGKNVTARILITCYQTVPAAARARAGAAPSFLRPRLPLNHVQFPKDIILFYLY